MGFIEDLLGFIESFEDLLTKNVPLVDLGALPSKLLSIESTCPRRAHVKGTFWPFPGIFDLAKFQRAGRDLFGFFPACLRILSFPPGLLTIPEGRA